MIMRIIESVGLQKGCARPFSGKAKLAMKVNRNFERFGESIEEWLEELKAGISARWMLLESRACFWNCARATWE